MGIDRAKSYSADKIKAALQALGYVVTACGPSTKNFLVQVSSGPGAVGTANDRGKQGISCGLTGQNCDAGGLVGQKGLKGLSEAALQNQ
jgi:hypothetical protein